MMMARADRTEKKKSTGKNDGESGNNRKKRILVKQTTLLWYLDNGTLEAIQYLIQVEVKMERFQKH